MKSTLPLNTARAAGILAALLAVALIVRGPPAPVAVVAPAVDGEQAGGLTPQPSPPVGANQAHATAADTRGRASDSQPASAAAPTPAIAARATAGADPRATITGTPAWPGDVNTPPADGAAGQRLTELAARLSDPDPLARIHAMRVVAGDAPEHAVPVLGQVVLGDTDAEARLEALRLLAADGSPAALTLVRAATLDRDEAVRVMAEALLEEPIWRDDSALARQSAIDPVIGTDAAALLAERLLDPDPGERIAAVHEAYFLDAETAARVLREVLHEDLSFEVREQALLALDYMGGEQAVEAMASALGDEDLRLRQQALQALWNAGSQTVFLLGQALFGDPAPEVRLRAVHLLAADASPAAMALLEAATADPDEAVRLTANRLLGR